MKINTRENFPFSHRASARKFVRAKISTNKVISTGLTSGDGTINYEEVLKLVEDNELALDAIHISQGQQSEAKDKPWRDSDGVEIGHMVEKLSGGW